MTTTYVVASTEDRTLTGVISDGNRAFFLRGIAQAIVNLMTAIPTYRNDDVRIERLGVQRAECRWL